MKLIAILAMDEERGIGKNGWLPWHCPQDLAHFKSTTIESPIIMGRKTFESIGRPLPKRTNIVLSRNMAPQEGIIICNTIASVLDALKEISCPKNTAYIIGGAEIYSLFLQENLIDELSISQIPGKYNSDVFAPNFESNFSLTEAKKFDTFELQIYKKNDF